MDLLQQMMDRFDTLTAEDVADGLVHRFALIRLTNMLGDWVLDYPGDLSQPDTNALLMRFHRQLLQHPDTVHTAAQIHPAVETTVAAPDLDALWSHATNSDKTRQRAAAAAAAAASLIGGQQATTGNDAEGLPASHSNGSNSAFVSISGNTSHDLDGSHNSIGRSTEGASETHERTGSESSLPMHSDALTGSRSRSASDLTTSSTKALPRSTRMAASRCKDPPAPSVQSVARHRLRPREPVQLVARHRAEQPPTPLHLPRQPTLEGLNRVRSGARCWIKRPCCEVSQTR